MKPQLRVYNGPTHRVAASALEQPENRTVEVRAGDIFPLLVDAIRCDRSFLQDFADDEVTISADLYDVLLAYQHVHRPSA